MNNLFSVRIFNEDGIKEFEKFLSEIKNNNFQNNLENLLFDENYSKILEPVINIERKNFNNKDQLIPYIVSAINLKDNRQLYFNKELWTWLGAFYFNNICPQDFTGKRKVKEIAFYVMRDPKNYTKYNRHLLAYPARIFCELGNSSKIFLTGDFTKRGEITEQIGAYQEIALNKGIIEAVNQLYWDNESKSIKRGAAGKGPGSIRRLIRIIRQYQMTYDLNSMDGSQIVSLLPNEFSKWISALLGTNS